MNNETGVDVDFFNLDDELTQVQNIHPKGWNVLVRLYVEPEQRKSGFILPASYRKEQELKSCQGFVLKIAQGVYENNRYEETGPWCKVGDCVIFSPYAGIKIHRDDSIYVFLKEDMIEAVVTNPINEIPKIYN